jgi:hypothetical protein
MLVGGAFVEWNGEPRGGLTLAHSPHWAPALGRKHRRGPVSASLPGHLEMIRKEPNGVYAGVTTLFVTVVETAPTVSINAIADDVTNMQEVSAGVAVSGSSTGLVAGDTVNVTMAVTASCTDVRRRLAPGASRAVTLPIIQEAGETSESRDIAAGWAS